MMGVLNISAGILGAMSKSLMSGDDDNMIERLIMSKIENMGDDVLMNLIPGLGVISRAEQAIATRGRSELDAMRNQWLGSITAPLSSIPGSGTARRIQSAFERNKHLLTRPGGEKLTWTGSKWGAADVKWSRSWSAQGGHWKWSKSRQEWLNESWRHDWRSQPRDPRGRWSPGRLRHPYISKGARRIRSVRRREARAAVRGIMSSWGQ